MLVLGLALIAASPLPFESKVEKLDNGMTVVMVPYASPGLVSWYTMVRVGSRDEAEPGVTGFAHFFEHMMFRGTKAWPPERIDGFLKKAGADQNGFTTDDFTCYTITGRSDFLGELIDYEADRFQNLAYTEDAFKTEAKAVLGEYNKNASNPTELLEERLRERVFKKHTYGHSTMGYLRDIEAMPAQYAYSRTFFERFYTPDNTIAFVVGDFDPGKLMPLVKKHFGPWSRKRAVAAVEEEPPQTEEIRDHIDWATPTLPILSMSWRTPKTDFGSKETAVYGVLGELLFGKVAAAYTELVLEKQVVDSFSDWSWNHRDPYLFHMVAKLKTPEAKEVVEKRIEQSIAELAAGKVDPRLLEDVKSNVRYGVLLGLDTPSQIASALSYSAGATGEVDALARSLLSLDTVTAADVQAFAAKYLTRENRSVVTLETKVEAK